MLHDHFFKYILRGLKKVYDFLFSAVNSLNAIKKSLQFTFDSAVGAEWGSKQNDPQADQIDNTNFVVDMKAL